MSNDVRIRVSLGIVMLALSVCVLHAFATVVSFMAIHQPPSIPSARSVRAPLAFPSAIDSGAITQLPQPSITHSVNSNARDELKQDSWCVPCQPSTRVVPSTTRVVQYPNVYYPTPNVYYPTPAPAPVIQPTQQPIYLPASTSIVSPPVAKNYELALFLGNDARSSQIKQWFDTDPKLLKMRDACNYQVFTEANPLYRTKYASAIPVEQFPVVLLQYADGGHIHAAGGHMIPSTAAALLSDMQYGFELASKAREENKKTGMIKAAGYRWDPAITPAMQLDSNCPDGICPDNWKPGDRARDLFDRAEHQAVVWAGAQEIVIVVVVGFLLLLVGGLVLLVVKKLL